MILQNNQTDLVLVPAGQLKPLDTICGFQVRPGFFLDFGATVIPGGVNFTIQSHKATSCELLLFHREAEEPFAVLPFPDNYRIGFCYSMIVFGLDIEEFEYAYRLDGPYDEKKGLRFDRTKILLDPYARAVTGQSHWGHKNNPQHGYRARVVHSNFDWGQQRHTSIPMEDLIIYELHVRGYTKDASSGVKHPGTFDGLKEKIPYLKGLGVNAVELMPVFEFDEMRDARLIDENLLLDFWGYNPVSFFAPNTSYSSSKEYNREGMELKSLIKELHDQNMEVILDVVFNHTAEGNEFGPSFSFKGFDNQIYYMLTPDGHYYNFSGCGNTLNCNHPVVQNMILDCLRYWVIEYRVDGFRFDLASILGRNEDGTPLHQPPLLRSLAFDSILGNVKLIAEAWDAGGLYQVGNFPASKRWAEWNGQYRDTMRGYLKGDFWEANSAAWRICGSGDLYGGYYSDGNSNYAGYNSCINFLTCHDGFTMYDLYSYNNKHNEANGWNNTDGANDNRSWNCGMEGDTKDPEVLKLRYRMIRNACAILMCSRGTPMFFSGDEFGNTKFGNNNSYCQDNEISWIDWSLLEKNKDLFEFFKFMIDYRKKHPVIRKKLDNAVCGMEAMHAHDVNAERMEVPQNAKTLAVSFAGYDRKKGKDDLVYVAVNAYWEEVKITLPNLANHGAWYLSVDTYGDEKGKYFYQEGEEIRIDREYVMKPRSIVVFTGREILR